MLKEKVNLGVIKLIGISARTNNKNEMDPNTAKIGQLVNQFWSEGTANQFKHRTKPGVTYSVYTDYASDEHGDYTYFLGEEVSAFPDQDKSSFQQLVIPASAYQKITTAPGKMPNIVIETWQSIWKMQASDLGGKRKYVADFEVYDERAGDLNNAVVDIYVGIEG